jgi:hypothetical protein
MYPHERSLVKNLSDKPFVLLGVNSDPDLEVLKKAMEKEQLTWRAFRNDGSTSGPIATRWNIRGWPTLYVIDAKGVIRHKWMGNPGDDVLDQSLNILIEEARKTGSAN